MAEELRNQVDEEVKDQETQENTTPETTPAEDKKDESKKEGTFSKLKRFGSTKVVPAAKATARVVGKMAIITGGILGAVFVAGIGAGMAAKDEDKTGEDTEDEESVSDGDEEIDEDEDDLDPVDDTEEDSAEE